MEVSSMKIVIAAAMQEELAPFRAHYLHKSYFKRGKTVIETVLSEKNVTIFLVETGIGKVNAAATTSLLCETIQPTIIINTGTAGGFSEEVTIGDVVLATHSSYSDVDATGFGYRYGQVPQMPENYFLTPKWRTYFYGLSEPVNYRLRQGLVVTADSFMDNQQLIERTKKYFPEALASDMESTAILQVATFYQIPVLNIRGISDMVGQKAVTSFHQNVNLAALHAFEQVKRVIEALVAT